MDRVGFVRFEEATLVFFQAEEVLLARLDVQRGNLRRAAREVEEDPGPLVVVLSENRSVLHLSADEGPRLEAVQDLAKDTPLVVPLEAGRDDPGRPGASRLPHRQS